jgi:hypothetical protein
LDKRRDKVKMVKLFNGVKPVIASKIETRRQAFRDFYIEQEKMSADTDYHVRPLNIDDIDFMDPLAAWDGMKVLNPVVSWIVKRIYQPEPKLNCVMMINGQTGSGKSYSAIKLGILTDDEFDVDSVCFSLREMRDRVEEGRKTIILDDVETFAHSRDSMTKLSKWLTKYFDMVRARRNFFILTAPSFYEVDKILRERTLVQGITKGVNIAWGHTILKTFFIEKEPNYGKIYKHRPIIFDENTGTYKKINDIRLGKPPDRIIKEYEDKKLDMFNKLGKNIDKIEQHDKIDKNKDRDKYQIYADEYIDGMSIKEIADKYNDKETNVKKALSHAKQVQYRIRDLRVRELNGIHTMAKDLNKNTSVIG